MPARPPRWTVHYFFLVPLLCILCYVMLWLFPQGKGSTPRHMRRVLLWGKGGVPDRQVVFSAEVRHTRRICVCRILWVRMLKPTMKTGTVCHVSKRTGWYLSDLIRISIFLVLSSRTLRSLLGYIIPVDRDSKTSDSPRTVLCLRTVSVLRKMASRQICLMAIVEQEIYIENLFAENG